MPHSYIKIWIHAIWATKHRKPFIELPIENKIHQFISEQFIEQGCPVRIVNGIEDHVHCLFLLSRQKSIAEVIKHIKGSSSHFINQNKLTSEKFAWQVGYAAFAVSESGIERVFQYIKNQKQHHKRISSQEEYDKYLKLYGLEDT